jgi:hypothetical protein
MSASKSSPRNAKCCCFARYRDTGVRLIKGDICFIKKPSMSKNIIRIIEFGGSDLKQQHLAFLGDDFDADMLNQVWFFGILSLTYQFVLDLGCPSLGVFGHCEVGFNYPS